MYKFHNSYFVNVVILGFLDLYIYIYITRVGLLPPINLKKNTDTSWPGWRRPEPDRPAAAAAAVTKVVRS